MSRKKAAIWRFWLIRLGRGLCLPAISVDSGEFPNSGTRKRAGVLSGAVVEAYDDHRLAMSLAVVGLKVPGIKMKDEHCVNKSFPRFWELWDRL